MMSIGFMIVREIMVKSPYDVNGCCISCGYQWCEALNECVRIWETYCSSLPEYDGTGH